MLFERLELKSIYSYSDYFITQGPLVFLSLLFLSFSEKAGVQLDGGSYLIHKVYDDEETLSLVGAACETLGMHFTSNLFIFLRIGHIQETLGSTVVERILENAT